MRYRVIDTNTDESLGWFHTEEDALVFVAEEIEIAGQEYVAREIELWEYEGEPVDGAGRASILTSGWEMVGRAQRCGIGGH